MDEEDSEFSTGEVSELSDMDSAEEEKPVGNMMWADAMAKVLGTRVKDKSTILTKAKKDTAKPQNKAAPKKTAFEIIAEEGHVVESVLEEKVEKKKRRRESVEKKATKQQWENLCRYKPDIASRDKERTLMKIATKGVVQLFNAVEKHQKTQKKRVTKSKVKKASSVKGSFMDMLKGNIHPKTENNVECVQSESPKKEPWKVLKEDFMMGATLKDWDKKDDEEEVK